MVSIASGLFVVCIFVVAALVGLYLVQRVVPTTHKARRRERLPAGLRRRRSPSLCTPPSLTRIPAPKTPDRHRRYQEATIRGILMPVANNPLVSRAAKDRAGSAGAVR